MKVIVPCAGKSTRFLGMRPKWMLNHPDGDLMVKKAVEGLGVEPKDIIITILKEHEEKYDIARGLKENMGEEITIIILDEQTKCAAETVYLTLKKTGITESFLVRDSDNIFIIPQIEEDFNYVCYSDLHEYSDIDPGNKSYIKMNEQNIITDIAEKKVIAESFNVGGFFFKDPQDFFLSFEELNIKNGAEEGKELYVSHIIEDLIINRGKVFFGKKVSSYFDWGTFSQWSKYCRNFKTYFLDIDGILLKNSAQFFKPRWEDAQPIEENLKTIKELSGDKNTQLFFITSRPEKYRQLTENKLLDIWNSSKIRKLRKMHNKKIFPIICQNCNEYSTEYINPRFE